MSKTILGSQRNGKASSKAKVLLVDDHPILRESFGQLINLEQDLEVCGQAGNPTTALAEVAAMKPDLVVVDIELNGASGIELIKRMKSLYPRLQVLALSVHDETLYAERAMRAGAQGYVMKRASIDEVMTAIRCVLRGERYLSAKMQQHLLDRFSGSQRDRGIGHLNRLTDRELEVFQLIGNGARTREIAEYLDISVKTVETYRGKIIEKLSLRDGLELVRYAVRMLEARSLMQ